MNGRVIRMREIKGLWRPTELEKKERVRRAGSRPPSLALALGLPGAGRGSFHKVA